MEFRPCIDIHNGKVKQIVGTSLQDSGNRAKENFVSEKNADFFAALYKEAVIKGGHVILLNPAGSEYYEETKRQALAALGAYPGGLQAAMPLLTIIQTETIQRRLETEPAIASPQTEIRTPCWMKPAMR